MLNDRDIYRNKKILNRAKVVHVFTCINEKKKIWGMKKKGVYLEDIYIIVQCMFWLINLSWWIHHF